MKKLLQGERATILRQIIRLNFKFLFAMLVVLGFLGSLILTISARTLDTQAYSITKKPTVKTASIVKAPAKTHQTPVVPQTAPTTPTFATTPAMPKQPAPKAAAPAPQPTPVAMPQPNSDFRLNNGSTTGWPMSTNVVLDLSLSFNPNYDNTRAVTINFAAPAGYNCPSITVLPSTTTPSASFVCYLPDNLSLGHKIFTMTATNGFTTSFATYDLNVISPTGSH